MTTKQITAKSVTGKKTTKSNSAESSVKKITQSMPSPKLSALNAATKVLSEADQPLGTAQLIEAMRAKGYWTSPGGKTPAATLYTVVTKVPKTC